MKTLEEIVMQLKQVDEITLIEMLNISSEDIVDRFRDIIENDADRFEHELQQFFPEEEDTNN